jgi:site-specific recombinase XerD
MGEITLGQGIEEYKNVYLPARNLAERTRQEYLNDLDHLVRFLEKLGKSRVEEIDLIHLERYLAELERRYAALEKRKLLFSARLSAASWRLYPKQCSLSTYPAFP